MSTRELTCKERVGDEYRKELARVRKLWTAYTSGIENGGNTDSDEGTWEEYGLCFDYVAPGTFGDQKRGYFRYQVSTGGPADEWRFYTDENLNVTRIEYWFLDWFDGAKHILTGKAKELLTEIFNDLKDCGTVQYEFDKAMQE